MAEKAADLGGVFVAVLCGMATTGVYAAYEPYVSVNVVGGTTAWSTR